MANRNGHDGAWERLGTLLQQRRTLLNPKWRNRKAFAADTGLHYRLVFDIEENRRTNFTTVTLTAIEVAYELQPGSITAFLDGGDLAPADAPVARVVPFPDLADVGERPASVRPAAIPYAARVLARLDILERKGIPREKATGADLFGAGSEDAGTWDQLRNEFQLDPRDAALSFGEVVAREAEEGRQPGTGFG